MTVAFGAPPVDQGAWTAYTPTVTALAGSMDTSTAAGRYLKIGKTVFWSALVTVSGTITATGFFITLPVNAVAGTFIAVGAGLDTTSGVHVSAFANIAGAGRATMYNTSTGVNFVPTTGQNVQINGTYESA